MAGYERVLDDFRQQFVVDEYFTQEDIRAIESIVDGFLKLGTEMGLFVRDELDIALKRINHFQSSQMNYSIGGGLSSFPQNDTQGDDDDDDDVFMTDAVQTKPVAPSNQSAFGSSANRPLAISPSPPGSPIVSSSRPAARPVAAPRLPAAAVEGEQNRRRSWDARGDQAGSRKRIRRANTSNINCGWMKKNMTEAAENAFYDYAEKPQALHEDIKERFDLVLKVIKQQKQQEQLRQSQQERANEDILDMIISIDAVPEDLRLMMRCYVSTTAMKSSEHYSAYQIAQKIHRRVEEENIDQAITEEMRARQVERVFSSLACSFKNRRKGNTFKRYCQRCKILADTLGVYALFLPNVFSKDFITKKIKTEADASNIAGVAQVYYPRQIIEAKIVDGSLIMEDLEDD